ncbi:reductase [uncultured Lactobacillus sp.]|uniref:reductase n=1 Tax=uncultured Lactobacillus sp. TaxID=153152 RepID=UPI002603DAAA|nr:reductase [uncultured Lactobacillus sp.]
MLSKYKKNYEKQVMGFLSYLPEFKNLENLREEMQLYKDEDQYQVLIFKGEDGDCRGIIGIQESDDFIVIRYLSLDPSFRNSAVEKEVIKQLQNTYPDKMISAMPDCTYLLKYTKQGNNNDDER